ncbi:hypothetical protein H8E52_12830 [bacterium]|nr:hypothetical protein [bacterium]
MLKKLVIVLGVLALAIPAMASVNRDVMNPTEPTGGVELFSTREAVEFNTCGAMDFPPASGGGPSSWAFWTVSVFTNDTGQDLCVTEIGAPTCEYSGEPIALPVIANILLNASDPFVDCPDPYTTVWDAAVDFTPVDPIDTLPPVTYTPVDMGGIVLPAGASMIWGYENAGYMGLGGFASGIETYGLYLGAWDADSNYGQTACIQFKADYCVTATEEATFGQIKTLY